jgi:predicted RNase H-like nuclease
LRCAAGAGDHRVDMPIGLPDRTGSGGRAARMRCGRCSRAAIVGVFGPVRVRYLRRRLRRSLPERAADLRPPPRSRKQLFIIAPKIREVDAALRADGALAARTFEVHPELAFWRLNGDAALSDPKR